MLALALGYGLSKVTRNNAFKCKAYTFQRLCRQFPTNGDNRLNSCLPTCFPLSDKPFSNWPLAHSTRLCSPEFKLRDWWLLQRMGLPKESLWLYPHSSDVWKRGRLGGLLQRGLWVCLAHLDHLSEVWRAITDTSLQAATLNKPKSPPSPYPTTVPSYRGIYTMNAENWPLNAVKRLARPCACRNSWKTWLHKPDLWM